MTVSTPRRAASRRHCAAPAAPSNTFHPPVLDERRHDRAIAEDRSQTVARRHVVLDVVLGEGYSGPEQVLPQLARIGTPRRSKEFDDRSIETHRRHVSVIT